jgi:hypothetical protein
MTSGKTVQATRLADDRINVNGNREIRTRNAKRNIGAKPRATARKAAAPAPLLDSRLKKVARVAFHLMGED